MQFVKDAADLLTKKLRKYELHFTSPFVQLFAALDPRLPNKPGECDELKARIRHKLEEENCVSFDRSDSEIDLTRPSGMIAKKRTIRYETRFMSCSRPRDDRKRAVLM